MKEVKHQTRADTSAAVDDFLAELSHPFKDEIEQIRRTILSVDSQIAEGIKWNAPSYRTSDYFATTHLREKNGVSIILHLGAKVRESKLEEASINDEMGLLRWLGKDRAIVNFSQLEDFKSKQLAFIEIVRQWIRYV